MLVRGHDIGVCSWSLGAGGMADLLEKLRALDVNHVQLALVPLLSMDDASRNAELHLLRNSGVSVTAGMVRFPGEDYSSLISIRKTGGLVPDDRWPERKELALRAGRLAADLGVAGVSLHVGFLPQSNDPLYGPALARLCEIAEPLQPLGVHLLLETGQETPNELLQFLNDLRCQNVACNFDPANLLMYGVGDPLESVAVLGRHIRHVHLKDAISSDQPGTKWGREAPLGRGQVPVLQIIDALNDVGYAGPLVIEREYEPSLDSIRAALQFIQDIQG
jgi:sugar phosphate isomerase/epimerase